MNAVYVETPAARGTIGSFYRSFALVLMACTVLVLFFGETKSSVDWVDVWGEAIAFAGSALWAHLVLAWRPLGYVTRWLGIGAGCMATGFYLDFLDEFYQFTNLPAGSFENVAVPLGVVMLTYALFLLGKEQRRLLPRHSKREQRLRDHTEVDQTTQLYGAPYLLQTIANARGTGVLAMVEVQLPVPDGSEVPPFAVAQLIRRKVADHLVTLAPDGSLVAHYAGDRFSLLLPDLNGREDELQTLIEASLNTTLAGALRLAGQAAIGVRCVAAVRPLSNDPPKAQLIALSRMLAGDCRG